MTTVDDDLRAIADRLNQSITAVSILAGGYIDPLRQAAQPNDTVTYGLLNQLTSQIQSMGAFLQDTLAQVSTAQADIAKLSTPTSPPQLPPPRSTTAVTAPGAYTVGEMAGAGFGGLVLGLGLGYMVFDKKGRRSNPIAAETRHRRRRRHRRSR
jgi:hypothetical protein